MIINENKLQSGQISQSDYKDKVKAGSMETSLNSDYSTLALRILANNGYLYRGSRINDNMGINILFGE